MNKGYVGGYVCNAYGDPVEGAIVKLKSLKTGKARIAIYDPEFSGSRSSHSDVSKYDGRFVVPFGWDENGIGDASCDPVFRLTVTHVAKKSFGYASDKFYVRPSIPALLELLALDGDPSGVLGLAESNLQLLADTETSANIESLGFGGCEVILHEVFSFNMFKRERAVDPMVENSETISRLR